jgi:hypothetical protein
VRQTVLCAGVILLMAAGPTFAADDSDASSNEIQAEETKADAKPVVRKKRVCKRVAAPGTRLGHRNQCRTIEVIEDPESESED